LPFNIKNQTKGAQKAYNNFIGHYGMTEGTRIYLQRAQEHGQGNTIRQKVNSIYKKGGHFDGNKGDS
jgi:hypothetical protein